ncbi:hypothetical protein CYMTET_53469 [Cymbomonas tetramitiformis]|uniref:WRKY19-like zinc finger domain-containing protein n=1 Tax=Cymbomonas tetramitiformis TaxID=36881 RepID=A0AAE0BIC5_9CHLO|nr:hypothetical protein CYMTET_53469 [Cymbomonas tetramitiformis]
MLIRQAPSMESVQRLADTGGVGKKCLNDGCRKAAQGSTPYCKAHGGGKRCQDPKCKKSAQGSTLFCVAHGDPGRDSNSRAIYNRDDIRTFGALCT